MRANDKLVCVEYSPPQLKGLTNSRVHLAFCIGETLASELKAAKKKLAHSERPTNIPVRFPLQYPNYKLAFSHSGYDALNPVSLMEEGLLIQSDHLVELPKRVPVSCYTREASRGYSKEKFDELFESSKYYSVFSAEEMIRILGKMRNDYPHCYTISREWYTKLCTVVQMYDRLSFGGVVVEVTLKPAPNAAEREQGIENCRQRRDVYLLTSTRNFVSEIDGTTITRWENPDSGEFVGALSKRYSGGCVIGAREFSHAIKKLKKNSEASKGSDTKKAYAMPVEPGSPAKSS